MGIQLNGITGDITITGDIGIGGTLTYEDVANVDSIGVITARDGIRCTGIVTATAFIGDGSQLTGVSGFSTALSNTQGTLENLIFKTTESFTVEGWSINRLESDNISGNTLLHKIRSYKCLNRCNLPYICRNYICNECVECILTK